mgnify:CR=1 FL=1
MYKKGFTLIELLIVVAIIAILAAIAVPNFLEAQVRAKTSRVKADMRSMAVAAEAYTVDNNKPPIGDFQLWANNGGPWVSYPTSFAANYPDAQAWKWKFWTTPVAYMTSVPDDPFSLAGKLSGGNNVVGYDKRYLYLAVADHSVTGTVIPSATAQYNAMKATALDWYIYSYGPSRKQMPNANGAWVLGGLTGQTSPPKAAFPDIFYDSSNGTMSYGMLIRSNRGVEPAIGLKK